MRDRQEIAGDQKDIVGDQAGNALHHGDSGGHTSGKALQREAIALYRREGAGDRVEMALHHAGIAM
jgi:hypothetical protein